MDKCLTEAKEIFPYINAIRKADLHTFFKKMDVLASKLGESFSLDAVEGASLVRTESNIWGSDYALKYESFTQFFGQNIDFFKKCVEIIFVTSTKRKIF